MPFCGKVAIDHIKDNAASCVSNVAMVVDGDPAGIHFHLFLFDGRECFLLARDRIVNLKSHSVDRIFNIGGSYCQSKLLAGLTSPPPRAKLMEPPPLSRSRETQATPDTGACVCHPYLPNIK